MCLEITGFLAPFGRLFEKNDEKKNRKKFAKKISKFYFSIFPIFFPVEIFHIECRLRTQNFMTLG